MIAIECNLDMPRNLSFPRTRPSSSHSFHLFRVPCDVKSDTPAMDSRFSSWKLNLYFLFGASHCLSVTSPPPWFGFLPGPNREISPQLLYFDGVSRAIVYLFPFRNTPSDLSLQLSKRIFNGFCGGATSLTYMFDFGPIRLVLYRVFQRGL